jgi:hypothetical protein
MMQAETQIDDAQAFIQLAQAGLNDDRGGRPRPAPRAKTLAA